MVQTLQTGYFKPAIVLLFSFLFFNFLQAQILPANNQRTVTLSKNKVDLRYPANSIINISGSGYTYGNQVSVEFKLLGNGNSYASLRATVTKNGTFSIPNYQVDVLRGGPYTIVVLEDNNNFPITTPFSVFRPYNELRIDGELKSWNGAWEIRRGNNLAVRNRGYLPNTQYTFRMQTVHGAEDYTPWQRVTVRSDEFGNWASAFTVWNHTPEGGYHLSTDGGKVKIVSLTLIPGPNDPAHDVRVAHIEVTQGLQNINNSITLIRGKQTWARVYVEGVQGGPVGNVKCYLRARRNGQVLTYPMFPENGNRANAIPARCPGFGDNWAVGCFDQPQDVDGTVMTQRENLRASFNFRIPAVWVEDPGEVTFEARAEHVGDPNMANNVATETVNLTETWGIHWAMMRIDADFSPRTEFNPTETAIANGFLQRIYPLAPQDAIVYRYCPVMETIADMVDLNDWQWVLLQIYWHRRFVIDAQGALSEPFFIYGMVHRRLAGQALNGLAGGPTTPIVEEVAMGIWAMDDPVTRAAQVHNGDRSRSWEFPPRAATLAHEFGHLLQLRHVKNVDRNRMDFPTAIGLQNGSATRGFSIHNNYPAVIPHTTRDLMAVPTGIRWISDSTYRYINETLNPCGPRVPKILAYLCETTGLVYKTIQAAQNACRHRDPNDPRNNSGVRAMYVCQFAGESISVLAPNLMVPRRARLAMAMETENQGLRVTDWMEINEWTLPMLKQLQAQQKAKSGSLTLEGLDASGKTLSQSFMQQSETSEGGKMWAVILADNAGYQKLRIKDQKGKQVFAMDIPKAEMKGTLKANLEKDKLRVIWSVTGAGASGAKTTFRYSADGKSKWTTVALTDKASGELLIPIEGLRGGTAGKLVATANNGYFQTETGSVSLNLPNNKPKLQWASILPKSFPKGDIPRFDLTAYDAEDGAMPGKMISWASSLQGKLGTGWSCEEKLKAGKHKITATAKDSKGAQTSLSFFITVE